MTLAELREELATRLGFSNQSGSDLVQAPLLNSFLQRAQQSLFDEFGSMLPGAVYPPTDFTQDSDEASIPDQWLLSKALLIAKEHYRQPIDVEIANWQNLEKGIRGFSA